MSPDDIITGSLNLMTFAFPGHISRDAGRASQHAAAGRSPANSPGLVPAGQLAVMSDPEMLRADFKPTGERYVLAARIGGKVPSAFPKGLPAPPGSASGIPVAHLATAAEPVNVVLVADADLLADQLWVQSQDYFGQRVHTAFANNGDFVVNALDNLLGSGDLISIRSRATFQRPFTRVQDLRREAEARFRSAEQRLQTELQETETRLSELQASRADQGAQILSPEQQAEIERFQARRLQLRKELRQVQRDLDRDIERLGSVLKVLNITVRAAVHHRRGTAAGDAPAPGAAAAQDAPDTGHEPPQPAPAARWSGRAGRARPAAPGRTAATRATSNCCTPA